MLNQINSVKEDIELKIPVVNHNAEFLEIASDFGNPLEIVREAVSNAYDWGADSLFITFKVENGKLIVEFQDNGVGMDERCIESFWNLGDSQSKGKDGRIGEKGHGTKIYLNSEKIIVITHHHKESHKSVCEDPKDLLSTGGIHKYTLEKIDNPEEKTGTYIRIEGYNDNERSVFTQERVQDYLYWYTKLGSFEAEFENYHKTSEDDIKIETLPEHFSVEFDFKKSESEEKVKTKGKDFKVFLKCLDSDKYYEYELGHKFGEVNDNIEKLKSEYEDNPSNYYVKKFAWTGTLEEIPEVSYQIVIYVEGDAIKRKYNHMIRERLATSALNQGKYKVGDRYGIWLAKDYIPIERKNEWISGFGKGSNSFVLLHGFVNCQNFRLTANRGSVAIPSKIEKELKKIVDEKVGEIDQYLREHGLWKMLDDMEETRTIEKIKKDENTDYTIRKESIEQRNLIKIKNRYIMEKNGQGELIEKVNLNDYVLLEPTNESEVAGVLSALSMIFPEKFEFDLLDYNTWRGIDALVREKAEVPVSESEYKYLELKAVLKKNNFNHTFRNLKWIVCWDLHKEIKDGTEIESCIGEKRKFKVREGDWYLEGKGLTPVKIIILKQIIKEDKNIEIVKLKKKD